MIKGFAFSPFTPFYAAAPVVAGGGAGTSGAGASSGSASTGGAGAGAGAGAGSSGSGAGAGAAGSPGTTPVVDGNRGEGALDHNASVEAMLAAVEAKKPGSSTGTVGESTQTSDGKPAGEAQAGTDNLSATDTTAGEQTDTTHPDATTDDTDGYTFEQDSFVGARDLAAKINAIPELTAALPQDLRDQIMANARLAETLAPYKEIFGSPEEAKIISSSAQEHANLLTIFSGIKGDNVAKNTSALIDALLQMSTIKDENGNPVKGADGKFRTDGTVGRLFKELIGRRMGVLEAEIKQEADDVDLASFDRIMGRLGLRTPTADQDQGLSEDIKRQKAELAAQRAELDRQRTEGEAKATREYTAALNSDLKTLTDGEIDGLLKNATGLSDELTKSAVVKALNDAITAGVKGNTAYQLEKERILQKPASPARRAEEVALAKTFLRNHLVTLAKPIFEKANIAVKKKGEQRSAEQAARARSAQGEVSGGASSSGTRTAVTGNDPASIRNAAVTALKTELNREPSDSEVNIYMMLNSAKLKKTA